MAPRAGHELASGPRDRATCPYWLLRATAPYVATFMGRAQVPMSNARIADELGRRPSYPTYREALALLGPASAQPPKRPRRARTLAT